MDLAIPAFLAVTVSLLGAFHFVFRWRHGDRAKVHERVAAQFGQRSAGNAAEPLFKDLDVSTLAPDQEYALVKGNEDDLASSASNTLRARWEERIRQAEVSLTLIQLLALAGASSILLALIAGMYVGGIGAIVGGGAGAVMPFWFIRFRQRSKQNKILVQLPGAFELMARVIRTGQSVPQAFQAVAEAFEQPLAGEFASCQHQQHLGLRSEVVFQEMANRIGILELRIFVMAMAIQRQTGGNLSEVLDRLALLIRSRLRLRQQVRTLTAEGRLQGVTLIVMPVVMFVAMMVLNRKYAEVLLEHPSLLWATGGFMAAGAFGIRWIVNFEV